MKQKTADLFRLKEPGLFSNRELFAMFFPILLEQLLINLLAMADTLLASQLSDTATAGVSHVISIDAMMKTFLSGLATGGSVLTAQWIGQGNLNKASGAARASVFSTGLLAVAVSAVLSVSPEWFICTLLGRPDEATLGYAITYFTVSVLSYPFLAIIYCCNATYRAQGNTRLPMLASVSMLVIAMGLKVLLTSVLSLGVLGCGLSNLIAAALTSLWVILCMVCGKAKVSFGRNGERLSAAQMFRSFQIGLPVALENALFQLGLVVVQRFVIGYGVIDSAAHGIAKQLQPLSYLPGQGWGMVLLVVVGRCIGKADKEQARKYTLYISGLCFASMLFVNIFCVAFIDKIVSLFGGAEETLTLVK
ncbi:MAG: hypothetical protein MJ118_07510 [Clostridia bacterium]|nr:hypothetical protein [Clostridia bacterium]